MSAPRPAIHKNEAMFMTVLEEMFNYDLRIKNMDKAKVDLAIVSLTCPNGSDYLHNIGAMVGVLSRVNAMSAGVRDKIKTKNALKLFEL